MITTNIFAFLRVATDFVWDKHLPRNTSTEVPDLHDVHVQEPTCVALLPTTPPVQGPALKWTMF